MIKLQDLALRKGLMLVVALDVELKEKTDGGIYKSKNEIEQDQRRTIFMGQVIKGSATIDTIKDNMVVIKSDIIITAPNLIEPFTLPIEGESRQVFLVDASYIFGVIKVDESKN